MYVFDRTPSQPFDFRGLYPLLVKFSACTKLRGIVLISHVVLFCCRITCMIFIYILPYPASVLCILGGVQHFLVMFSACIKLGGIVLILHFSFFSGLQNDSMIFIHSQPYPDSLLSIHSLAQRPLSSADVAYRRLSGTVIGLEIKLKRSEVRDQSYDGGK